MCEHASANPALQLRQRADKIVSFRENPNKDRRVIHTL